VIGVSIGVARSGALVSAPFDEPNWGGRDSLDLMLALMSPAAGVTIEPSWHVVRLSRFGDTDPVTFAVTPGAAGMLEFILSLLLPKELALLEEFRFSLPVVAGRKGRERHDVPRPGA